MLARESLLRDNLVSIQQCDAKQTVQLNTQTRTYLESPFDAGSATGSAEALEKRKKGGQVTYSTTVTDTGESQPMLGFTRSTAENGVDEGLLGYRLRQAAPAS